MKEKHLHKGERGIIIDVIPTKDPLVSKLLIKLDIYRPSLPDLKIVIEAKEVCNSL